MGKFEPKGQKVEDIINSLASNRKIEDANILVDLYKRLSGYKPVVWYPGIIGFGEYTYETESGIKGQSPIIAFAPRKNKISLYIDRNLQDRENLLKKLGKHTQGASCVYVNRLQDINLEVLEEILIKSMRKIEKRENNG